MAVEKILFKIETDSKGAVIGLKATKDGFQDVDLTVKNAEKSVQKLNQMIASTGSGASVKGIKLTTSEYNNLVKTQNQLKNSTGAATSATLELGRAISDAPYGIRGVANNISQFASQFSFMANSVDSATGKVAGFNGAMKNLGRAIKANAILLTIQAIVSAFDYFYGSQEKVKNSTEEVSKALDDFYGGSVSKINSYVRILEDVNIEEKERLRVTNELIKQVPNLTKEDFAYGDNLDIVKEKIANYVLAQASRVEADALVQEHSEKLAKKSRVNRIKEIEDETKRVEEIRKFFFEQKISPFKAEKSASYMGLAPQQVRKTNKDILEEFTQFEEDLNKEVNPILGKIDELYKSFFSVNTEGGDSDFMGEFQEIPKLIGKGLQDLKMPKIEGLDIVIKPRLKDINDVPENLVALNNFQNFMDNYKTIYSGLTEFISGEFDRQLTIEQNKTNVLNQELNDRLQNEELSKDQRASIQNKIAANDEALRKKQDNIKRKAFNTEKAFNISTALIDTYAGATSVFRNTLANPINKLLPDAGLIRAKINAGIAVAGGLLKVAAISRQKFQSTAPSTPSRVSTGGGSSSSTQSRQPIFNIVGRNDSNQLADAIQSQFNQPLKAYVVSKEVTSQQQLDLNIQSSASI